MHGQAINFILLTAVLFALTFFNAQLFASSDSAGCMGCHQGEVITTIDDQIDEPSTNQDANKTNNSQNKTPTN